jgi:hypothetical protein
VAIRFFGNSAPPPSTSVPMPPHKHNARNAQMRAVASGLLSVRHGKEAGAWQSRTALPRATPASCLRVNNQDYIRILPDT